MPSKRFAEFGIVPRANAKCVHCGALERHRLVWLYFERMTDLFDGRPKSTLHVAPEQMFENLLKRYLGSCYLTADLHKGNLSERVFLFELFIVLLPKKIVISFTDNPELVVVLVVISNDLITPKNHKYSKQHIL